MNGTTRTIPKFLEGINIPDEYFNTPDPYAEPKPCYFNLSEMVKYAKKIGKDVKELSREEAQRFCSIPMENIFKAY